MIRFDNVGYTYRRMKGEALKNVSFELEQGSFHFITGPSGAGKTTLFRMLYLDLKPSQGHITLFGKSTKNFGADEIALTRRRMGVVFQNYRLLPELTVRENVSLPLSLHGKPTPAQEKCVNEILDWVGLGEKLNAYPEQLSGGEQQRVAIARAVVNRPRLLIADEPTGNVDEAMGKRIMHLFTELNKHGTTVLIATHDKALIDTFDYPALFLQEGRLMRLQSASAAA